MADSPFRTFNGVEPFPIFAGVGLHAIAGDQVFLGRVTYEPGTTVKRHSHEHTEQAMLDRSRLADDDDRRRDRELGAGRRRASSTAASSTSSTPSGGVTFIEALAPVPLDHIGDRERDLVLGDLNGSLHVER